MRNDQIGPRFDYLGVLPGMFALENMAYFRREWDKKVSDLAHFGLNLT
jgi:hypothetical protein